MMSECSVAGRQNGASSACLNRLSLEACDQLSSPGLSTARRLSTRSARLQTVRSVKACLQPSREWADCVMTWNAHACRTCTGWPAFKQALNPLPPCGGLHSSSAGTSAGSSSRRTALGRAASLAVDKRVLMLRSGVCCSRGYSRRFMGVARLDQHVTLVLKSKASCTFAWPVMCSLCQRTHELLRRCASWTQSCQDGPIAPEVHLIGCRGAKF